MPDKTKMAQATAGAARWLRRVAAAIESNIAADQREAVTVDDDLEPVTIGDLTVDRGDSDAE